MRKSNIKPYTREYWGEHPGAVGDRFAYGTEIIEIVSVEQVGSRWRHVGRFTGFEIGDPWFVASSSESEAAKPKKKTTSSAKTRAPRQPDTVQDRPVETVHLPGDGPETTPDPLIRFDWD